jgi:hypothetical protein
LRTHCESPKGSLNRADRARCGQPFAAS